jgi:hypothetical protein
LITQPGATLDERAQNEHHCRLGLQPRAPAPHYGPEFLPRFAHESYGPTLETIRREPLLSNLPVALLTGCDQDTEVARASALHADDYLIKPLSPTVLLNRVKRILAAAPPRKNPPVLPLSGDWPFGAGLVPATAKGV